MLESNLSYKTIWLTMMILEMGGDLKESNSFSEA